MPTNELDKIGVSRRLLGTALDLFLRLQDPVSVHCLAMAGGEIAEWLAEKFTGSAFKNHILETFPSMDIKELREIQRRYANAFKHATNRKGQDRNDISTLAQFDGTVNDATLFIGWYDFGMSGQARPIEAQVFEAWYLAKHPEKISSSYDVSGMMRTFPNLATLTPHRQHAQLLAVIRKAHKNRVVMNDPNTDRRPLMLPWNSTS